MSKVKELMEEGRGETIMELGAGEDTEGLSEEEMQASIATLKSIADILEADCNMLRSKPCDGGKRTEQWLIRHKSDTRDFMEIRVAVVGNVDAGKSTLLGVLTHGELDNGRGHARLKLFRHKHEAESGRTSSVGNDILDFGMLMVGSNAGIVGMTKEHLGLALALSVPVFVVVTKIDMCPPNVLQETLKLLVKILKSPGCRKFPVLVKSKDDVILSATEFVSERLCPIFQVSNVSGENLDL